MTVIKTGLAQFPVTLTANASDITPFMKGPYTYVWTFDDGETLTGQTINKTWKFAGYHSGKILVTDIQTNLSTTLNFNINIIDISQASEFLTIYPTSVTLNQGDTQQFEAFFSYGTPAFTWSTDTDGTIDSTGLYTAGTTSGTVTVAITINPSVTAIANVTVNIVATFEYGTAIFNIGSLSGRYGYFAVPANNTGSLHCVLHDTSVVNTLTTTSILLTQSGTAYTATSLPNAFTSEPAYSPKFLFKIDSSYTPYIFAKSNDYTDPNAIFYIKKYNGTAWIDVMTTSQWVTYAASQSWNGTTGSNWWYPIDFDIDSSGNIVLLLINDSIVSSSQGIVNPSSATRIVVFNTTSSTFTDHYTLHPGSICNSLKEELIVLSKGSNDNWVFTLWDNGAGKYDGNQVLGIFNSTSGINYILMPQPSTSITGYNHYVPFLSVFNVGNYLNNSKIAAYPDSSTSAYIIWGNITDGNFAYLAHTTSSLNDFATVLNSSVIFDVNVNLEFPVNSTDWTITSFDGVAYKAYTFANPTFEILGAYTPIQYNFLGATNLYTLGAFPNTVGGNKFYFGGYGGGA